jgi:uncharacterized protein (DUF1684 family)
MQHRLGIVAVSLVVALATLLAQSPAEQSRIAEWRRARVAELTADDGWLTLAGLDWLHEGANHAGSARRADVPLPLPAPADLGTFVLAGDRVRFTSASGAAVTSGGRTVSTLDIELDKTVLESGSLRMIVIKRGTRIGLRVRDLASPSRRAFKGLDYFPIEDPLHVRARFEPFTPPKQVPIINVLGDLIEAPSPGRLVFKVNDVEYSLDALMDEPGSTDLFVIFRDKTNGKSTYPAGRYLHVAAPVNGQAEVDFNEAYNPPCAFTEFATCPLPPKQNWLPIPIQAGERVYHGKPASSAIN